MKTLLFIILCIVVFGMSISVGKKIAIWKIEDIKYGDLKVKWNDSVGKLIKDVSYGDKEIQKYDLYLPVNQEKEKYSLIVHIHGGGFNSGDKSEGRILMKHLASEGYVAASVNYSLMDDTHTSNLNVMYDEIIMAAEQIVKRSKEEGYEVNEMALTGESAGGCLAMLTAFQHGNEAIVPIRFVFQESGPASFEPSLWADTDDQGKIDFVNSMTGEIFTLSDINTEAYQAAIEKISPASYINENTIPMLIAYGVNDKIVPPAIKEPLLKRLEECHVDYKYYEFPNSGHALLGDKDILRQYQNSILDYCNHYFMNSANRNLNFYKL